MKTLSDIQNLKDKKVIVRVDFNVPVDSQGDIKNDKRITFAIPTLEYLLNAGVKQVILMSHLGRPKNNEPHLKSNKVAERIGKWLNEPIAKVDDWGESGLPETKLVMLENLRFNPAEKSKDPTEREAFGKQLASLADLYVNDAFSNSHRDHASMTAVPQFIPGFAGLGVEKEVQQIKVAIENPAQPLVAIIGGLKADKLGAIKNLLEVADEILVAGALAFTLLKANGKEMGDSKVDDEGLNELSSLVSEIKNHPKVRLPVDAVVANEFGANSDHKIVSVDEVEKGWMALDIGPETSGQYVAKLKEAKTILWFGPIGVFEIEPFSHGTRLIGHAMADSQAMTIVGGGDSASAVATLGLEEKMSLVSTGGGASLTLIEGKLLPAVEALK